VSRKGWQIYPFVEWGGSTPTSERGSSDTQKTILEIDESGSTSMTSDLAMHDPSAGLEFLAGQCMGIRCDVYREKSSVAVRALDVRRPIIGLCTFLEGEGGGAPFVDFCESHLDAKLIVSACRGEVFIFETPSHTILRINNFDFHACCIECALTYERTHSQTFAQSDIQRLCDFDQRHNDYFSRHALAHNVRSCVYVCTCVHSIVCLCMQASTIHSHATRPASAAQVAKSQT
jgi:hypothetical protein